MAGCNHTGPCGCGDQPLMTPPPCAQTGPCAGEPCSELFCEECIVHCQPEISITIPDTGIIEIRQGMRWDEILQTMLIAIANAPCAGVSAVGLQMVSKTSTAITIKWVPVAGVNYTVTWQEGLNVYTAIVHDVTTYTLLNLVPSTEYTIKLTTAETECDSVIMKVTTNATPIL